MAKSKNICKFFIVFYSFLNYIFLSINLYFIDRTNNHRFNEINKIINNNKFFSYFKNVDLFSINITVDSYENNSFYLSSKFNIRFSLKYNPIFKLYNGTKSGNIKLKKLIRIFSVGSSNEYYQKLYRNNIMQGLGDKYNFVFTSENPDYLIYDVFNCDFLDSKYDNAIKIAFYTENQIPDFNSADYAISFHNLNYLDRYLRKTTLIWILENRYINQFSTYYT